MSDLQVWQFPRSLDDHPLLGWMQPDWVTYIAFAVLEELRKQDPGTDIEHLVCRGEPAMATSVASDGAVRSVTLSLQVEIHVVDGTGTPHELRGDLTVGGPDPRSVALTL